MLIVALSASSFAMDPKRGESDEAEQKKQEAQQQVEQNARAREATAVDASTSSLEARGTTFSPEPQKKKSSTDPDPLTPTTDSMRVDAATAKQAYHPSGISIAMGKAASIGDVTVEREAVLKEAVAAKYLSQEDFVVELERNLEKWKSQESEMNSMGIKIIAIVEQLFQKYSSLEKEDASNEVSRGQQQPEVDLQPELTEVMTRLQNDQKYYQALKKIIEGAPQLRSDRVVKNVEKAESEMAAFRALLQRYDEADPQVKLKEFSENLSELLQDDEEKEMKFCAKNLKRLMEIQAEGKKRSLSADAVETRTKEATLFPYGSWNGMRTAEALHREVLVISERNLTSVSPANTRRDTSRQSLDQGDVTPTGDDVNMSGDSSRQSPYLLFGLPDGIPAKGQVQYVSGGALNSKVVKSDSTFHIISTRSEPFAVSEKFSLKKILSNPSHASLVSNVPKSLEGGLKETDLPLFPGVGTRILSSNNGHLFATAEVKGSSVQGYQKRSPVPHVTGSHSGGDDRSTLADRIATNSGLQNEISDSWINARFLTGSAAIVAMGSVALFGLYEWYLHHLPSATSS